ncbi:terminase gpA endonuclease subunit [Maritalea porphyrae]|uniref:terminase gpA endonuclease subunit n=1 Tax=Maritalea porphyrae TaxID=880732 RepID=UPI0022AF8F8F|nr:terminase gpA endonuclease subunit [Maritalea porphyrae]MCZ4274001.1 phage terminase large subunit family protein [Maritalea porphyrae]
MREIGQAFEDHQLPPFASARDAALLALPALVPPSRVSVSQSAEKVRLLNSPAYRGLWDNSVTPYMVEPADVLNSRVFEAEAFCGPARTGKTDALLLNGIAHRIVYQPRNIHVVHMTKDTGRKFSKEKIDKMLRDSPELSKRLTGERNSNNTFDKAFMGGMTLTIDWPAISQLSGYESPDMFGTDYDRMPLDIDGEGDLFSLMRKRNETYFSQGMTCVESSPGHPILDEDWKPEAWHDAPPTTGILSIYNMGTRGRWYWPCPHCEEKFEPIFDLLKWEKGASPSEAGEMAKMKCPHCGYADITHDLKRELQSYGVWLHEGRHGDLVTLDGDIRPTTIASHWMQGPAAAFSTWKQLVQRFLEGVEHYRKTGDEGPLKTTVNVDRGEPYLPRAMSKSGALTVNDVRKKVIQLAERTAPGNTRFITIVVDVQGAYFICHADAWADGLERTLIDRFRIFKPIDDADRPFDPARYHEDWLTLDALLKREYRVDGTEFSLVPIVVASDSAGEPGVTEKAYEYWRRKQSEGLGDRFRLLKGNSNKTGDVSTQRRAYTKQIERSSNGKKAATDISLIWVGTDILKDEVTASLRRTEPGAGSYHISSQIDVDAYAEFCAERRTAKGWQMKPGVKRNEALDLSCYGKAVVIVIGAEKIDPSNPPDWALPVPQNSCTVDNRSQTLMVQSRDEPPKDTERSDWVEDKDWF